jgi:hypothetical protein
MFRIVYSFFHHFDIVYIFDHKPNVTIAGYVRKFQKLLLLLTGQTGGAAQAELMMSQYDGFLSLGVSKSGGRQNQNYGQMELL